MTFISGIFTILPACLSPGIILVEPIINNSEPAVVLKGMANPPLVPANIVNEPRPAVAAFATDSLTAVISPVIGTIPEITTEPIIVPAWFVNAGKFTIEPATRSPGIIRTEPIFPIATVRSAAVVWNISSDPVLLNIFTEPKTGSGSVLIAIDGMLTILPATLSPGIILTEPIFPIATVKSVAVVCQISTLPN